MRVNGFHIFSSAPFFAKHKGQKLITDKSEVYCTVLSALTWRAKNGDTTMITDKKGAEYFKALGIEGVWNRLDDSLSDNAEGLDTTMFWAGAKLLALRNFPAPCVMIDTDFIVWESLKLENKIIAAHEEELNPEIYPDISHFSMRGYTFPEGLDFSLKALNTAFLYMPDEDFKQYYTSQAIAFMKCAESCDDFLTYMVFAEQRLLPMLCKKCGMPYGTLLDYRTLFLPQSYFTHLWGAKQQMREDKESFDRFCKKCRDRIRQDFPEYSYVCESIEEYFSLN